MDKFNANVTKLIIKKTLRVPMYPSATLKKSDNIARQLDVALMDVGFKLSAAALEGIGNSAPVQAVELSRDVLEAVCELVGDHVRHNVYFKDFPQNVPDTFDFWRELILDKLIHDDDIEDFRLRLRAGHLNLLELPKYGKYLHSYEEMVAAHDKFIASAGDRITILHLGKTLQEEADALYLSLAGSRSPLSGADLELLKTLSRVCATEPDNIPVRENKAVINASRLSAGLGVLADTPTDILRLACALCGGDVTLEKPTKFKSIPRKHRAALLKALEAVTTSQPGKVADVVPYAERWKRLGEYLHPHEYGIAMKVFEIARGEVRAQTLMSRAEAAFANGDIVAAAEILAASPGLLVRNLDRLLRTDTDVEALLHLFEGVAPNVSGRVLLSLREHFQNRMNNQASRIFANTHGTAYIAPDERGTLGEKALLIVCEVIDAEVAKRLPELDLVIGEGIEHIALPISNKQTAAGLNVLPRGSESDIEGDILRFFCYWHEHSRTTDFDLSAQLLDENFNLQGQISFTNLKESWATHSGDLVSAENGATEFIDVKLGKVTAKYIVPQVNVYAGENFTEVDESFFGFMIRTAEQKGKPFEPKTVRVKSDVRGEGRVALPVVFINEGGSWRAKWLHLYLKGQPRFNQVENNHLSTAALVRAVVERQYLMVAYLLELLQRKAKSVQDYAGGKALILPDSTFIGLETPEGLPEDVTTINLTNLQEILPE
jgi:stress response protein SCP2